jgi:hypothetical protein
MSSSQKIVLLNGVNAAGPGSAFQWDGGPAVVMAWWDGASGVTLGLEVSPDGGTHWTIPTTGTRYAPGNDAWALNNLISGSGASITPINLPPMTIRGHVLGTPTNLSLVIQGYDQAEDVPNCNGSF